MTPQEADALAKRERRKAEAIERWKCHVAGFGLYGLVVDSTMGPMQRAQHALSIPGAAERLIGLMFDDFCPQPKVERVPQK